MMLSHIVVLDEGINQEHLHHPTQKGQVSRTEPDGLVSPRQQFY